MPRDQTINFNVVLESFLANLHPLPVRPRTVHSRHSGKFPERRLCSINGPSRQAICTTEIGQQQTFSTYVLGVAEKTVDNFIARLHRLYEQKKTAPGRGAVLGGYVLRWLRWVPAGISKVTFPLLTHPLRCSAEYKSCSFNHDGCD
jgi:hypothetical protein